ncbi:MAG: hypothetical protein ACJAZ3_001869 [Sphingobacteriales bacterium]|jgi:hypothetical protein
MSVHAFYVSNEETNHLKINKMNSKITLALVLLFTVFGTVQLKAQEDKSQRKSPPAVVEGEINGVNVTVDYSQPSLNDRTVWGDLVKYDKVWRTGANEATKITFDKDVLIEGKDLSAGTYGLFTIPTEGKWTVIFNTEADQWGSYGYKAKFDALRVQVEPKANDKTEVLTFDISDSAVELMWDEIAVGFEVEAK